MKNRIKPILIKASQPEIINLQPYSALKDINFLNAAGIKPPVIKNPEIFWNYFGPIISETKLDLPQSKPLSGVPENITIIAVIIISLILLFIKFSR